MKFYVCVCDKYLKYVQGYAYLFEKYWPLENQEVVFLGYKEPNFELPNNFKFVSLGKDPGQFKWSNALLEYFNSIDDEYFGWSVENLWLAGQIKHGLIEFSISEIENNNIDKIVLLQHESASDTLYKKYNKEYNLFKFDKESNCKCTLVTQIVKQDFFTKYLFSNKSPWQYEQEGQSKSHHYDENVLFTSIETSPKHADIVNRGSIRRGGNLGIKNLGTEDLKYLRENKFISF